MKYISLVGAAGLFLLVGIGCDRPAPVAPPSSQSVVVDLEAVAKALSWDSLIAGKVEEATRHLNAQLVQAAKSMESELKTQQAGLGANPFPEQLEAFKQAQARVQQNIQNNKLIAEQAREAVRNEQILLFRKRVKPVAGRVARQHEAEVVLIANEDVVWFDANVDITGEVIAAMRAEAMYDDQPASDPPETNAASPASTADTNTASGEAATADGD